MRWFWLYFRTFFLCFWRWCYNDAIYVCRKTDYSCKCHEQLFPSLVLAATFLFRTSSTSRWWGSAGVRSVSSWECTRSVTVDQKTCFWQPGLKNWATGCKYFSLPLPGIPYGSVDIRRHCLASRSHTPRRKYLLRFFIFLLLHNT